MLKILVYIRIEWHGVWEGRGEIKTKFGDINKSYFLISIEVNFWKVLS